MDDELLEDLNVGIARSRGGHNAGKIASHLLENDGKNQLLIGLDEFGKRAFAWSRTTRSIVEIELPDDGRIQADGCSRITDAWIQRELEAWIREYPGEMAWVHPRFRWLIDVN